MSRRPTSRAAAGIVAAAGAVVVAASFAVPATLAYDPWAWLVWGRGVGRLALDTTGGPSWKPLPVLPAVAIAPLGGSAPVVWLVLVRSLALVGLAGAYRLARTIAGSPAAGLAAGLAAVALVVLTPDAGPRFVRLALEGHSAAVTAGLAVWAVERHLADRPRATLWLLFALALDRPEAWPFLGAYALWAGRRQRIARGELAVALALVPVLWFGGDWWGSGSALQGAGAAQDVPAEFQPVGGALERAIATVVTPVWVAALGGTAVWAWQWRQGDRATGPLTRVAALTGLALAWYGLVLGMNAAFGFAALSRFFLPAAALLCVAAAVAATEAVRAVPDPAWRPVAAVAAVALTLPAAVGRTAGFGDLLREAEARAREVDGLADAIDTAGDTAGDTASHTELWRCEPLSIDGAGVPRPAMAWLADVPLVDIARRPPDPPEGTMVLRAGGDDVWTVQQGPCR